MPERTPYLHAANPRFHKEVRNQPRWRRRAPSNAPSITTRAPLCASTSSEPGGSGRSGTLPDAMPLRHRERPNSNCVRTPRKTRQLQLSLDKGDLTRTRVTVRHARRRSASRTGEPPPSLQPRSPHRQVPRPHFTGNLTSPASGTPPGTGPPGPPRPPSPRGGRRRSTCAGRRGRHGRGRRPGRGVPRRGRGGRRPPR